MQIPFWINDKIDFTSSFKVIIISALIIVIFSWICFKITVYCICVLFKIKLNFKFNSLYELRDIQLTNKGIDLNEDDESKQITSKFYQISIGKLWITSCYLNRNVNDRCLICLQDVNLDVYNYNLNKQDGILDQRNNIKLIIRLITRYISTSLSLDNLNINVNINNNSSLKSNAKKLNLKIETNSYSTLILNSELLYANAILQTNDHKVIMNFPQIDFNLIKSKQLKHNESLIELNIYESIFYIKSLVNYCLFSPSTIDCSFDMSNLIKPNFFSANKMLNNISKKISINNFKLILNDNTDKDEESIYGDLSFNDQNETKKLSIKNLHYAHIKRGGNILFNYELLNRFELINKTSSLIEIKCYDVNFYLNSILLNKILISKFLINYFNSSDVKKSEQIDLRINLKNIYLNLMADTNCIYTFGSKSIELNKQKNSSIEFNLLNLIVFKSSMNIKINKFENNLFSDNKQEDVIKHKIFLINSNKYENEDDYFLHYWGNVLNMNKLSIKYSNGLVESNTDSMFIEHSAEHLKEFIAYLSNFPFKLNNSTRNKILKVNLRIRAVNFYFLFENKYLICFNLTNLHYKHGSHLKINRLTCIEHQIDHKQNNSLFNATNTKSLNFHFIKYYKKDENLNLIILIQNFILIMNKSNYYVTLNDIMLTWSFRLHYIFLQELIKPMCTMLNSSNYSSNNQVTLKLLIDSNILINFLFDYQHDSSKAITNTNNADKNQTRYFNTSMNTSLNDYINTISIILNSIYFDINLSSYEFDLYVNFFTMFINVDDQSICSSLLTKKLSNINHNHATFDDDLNHQECENPIKRKFFHTNNFKLSFKSVSTIEKKDFYLNTERKMLNTKNKFNKCVSVNIELLLINFIYNYDFAKLFDHILNLRKCLLLVHDISNNSNPNYLSSDFSLIINKFQLTIEDDPFEVKLAYNYSLMNDEYFESIKRRQTLEQRRVIKEQNLENEAFELLRKKETLIYLKRSFMLYKQNKPIRTQLFCFQVDKVNLYALADTNWSGRQNCYNLLCKIDSQSQPPIDFNSNLKDTSLNNTFNPANNYSILWARHVNLNFNGFQFLFRDYTQPLLKMSKVNLFGMLCGSEYAPHSRSKRDVQIKLYDTNPSDDDNEKKIPTFNIQRSMSPFKFYHDFCSKMGLFSFAYGPCWEGCMAQLNLSLDKIIHPPRDPSRPMPWWDKSRLYLHGRFSSLVQQTQIIYHVSMDPYNHTEEMKLVWTKLYFDWTNSNIFFKGMLDIYLNTESKYDDCCLLHMNNLEMRISLEWLCKSSIKNENLYDKNMFKIANAHNYVTPCAPDKIPIIVNSFKHDSYAQFRSEKVNVTISFICQLNQQNHNLTDLSSTSSSEQNNNNNNNKQQQQQNLFPTLKFYASTSRFLQRIKNLLSAITRPTKRGRLFLNQKPRKPILSRHFNFVNIKIDLPKLNIIYWSSSSEEYGIQLECEHLQLNSTHKLDLMPFEDNLKRRPRPCWSIILMKCNVDQTNIFLMSPNRFVLNQQNNDIQINSSNLKQPDFNNLTQAEYDLLMLGITSDLTVKFLDSQPAVRNFFMQIDYIYYERGEKEQCTDANLSNHVLTPLKSHLNKTHNNNNNNNELRIQKKSLRHSSSLKANNTRSNKRHHTSKLSANNSLKIKLNTKKNLHISNNQVLVEEDNKSILPKKSINILPLQTFGNNRPKHNLVVKNLKAKWNNINRDVLYTLYEIYNKSKRLRHNISSQALKEYDFSIDQNATNLELNQENYIRYLNSQNSILKEPKSTNYGIQKDQSSMNMSSSLNSKSEDTFTDLLNKLDNERQINSNIFCNEKANLETSSSSNYNDLLYGMHSATRMSDILHDNIFIELINSQIKLSLEDNLLHEKSQQSSQSQNNKQPNKYSPLAQTNDLNEGEYLIISAARTNVVQRIHKPIWKAQRILEKLSWTGHLEDMQYFATLSLPVNHKSKKSIRIIDSNFDQYWLDDNLIDPSNTSFTSCRNSIKRSKNSTKKDFADYSYSNDSELMSDELLHDFNSSSSSISNICIKNRSGKMRSNNKLGMLISYDGDSKINNEFSLLNKKEEIENITNIETTKKNRIGLMKLNRNNQNQSNLNTNFNQNSLNDANEQPQQQQQQQQMRHLQLIVSKCRCEFYIIDFDDKLSNNEETSASSEYSSYTSNFKYINSINQGYSKQHLNNQIDLNSSFNDPIDCFTLIHHDLNLCTNSKQYKMIMNLVNNLVLYFRPRRKQVIDKQKSIKFNLQLSMGNLESLKEHIQCKQLEAKQLLFKLRMLERKLYHSKEKIQAEMKEYNLKYQQNKQINTKIYSIHELRLENKSMDREYKECKKMLNDLSDELNISIGCYKELMLERRAFNLANTPLFVQHVLYNNNLTSLLPHHQNVSIPSNFLSNHSLFNTSYLDIFNIDLIAPSANSSIYKIHNANKLISADENRQMNSTTLDLDQQAQQSILNNEIGRRYEVWFKQTKWKLNDDKDGETGLAKFVIKNLLYTKVTNQQELDCVEHNLEVESCKIKDLTQPFNNANKKTKRNFSFKDYNLNDDLNVLTSLFKNRVNNLNINENENLNEHSNDNPPETYELNVSNSTSNEDNKKAFKLSEKSNNSASETNTNLNSVMFRIYCKERPPVGIPVIEHLEVNVAPLLIKLSNRFYKTMISFFFESNNTQSPVQITSATNSNQTNVNYPIQALSKSQNKNFGPVDEINNGFNLNLGSSSITNTSSSNANATNLMTSATISSNLNTTASTIPITTSSSNINDNNMTTSHITPTPSNSSNLKIMLNHAKKASQSSINSNTKNSINIASSNSPSSYVVANSNNTNQLQIDDIEIMKQRSANNSTFLCIKITEIQLMVSYKGGDKEKNLKDLNNVCLLFPLFEVHDKTWTWLDLINALKAHVKKALLSQALKHKLIKVPIQPVNKLINRNKRNNNTLSPSLTNVQIDEQEKMTILKLFGTKLIEKESQFPTQHWQQLPPMISSSGFATSNKQQEFNEESYQQTSIASKSNSFKIGKIEKGLLNPNQKSLSNTNLNEAQTQVSKSSLKYKTELRKKFFTFNKFKSHDLE